MYCYISIATLNNDIDYVHVTISFYVIVSYCAIIMSFITVYCVVCICTYVYIVWGAHLQAKPSFCVPMYFDNYIDNLI